MTLAQEKKLVDEARKNPDKFGVLFDRHYQQIFDYVLRRVGDVPTAQDIASTVFYKSYKNLWQFKWRGVPFVAWLYRIASNEVKSYYRKAGNNLISIENLEEESGFEVTGKENLEQELLNAELELEKHFDFLRIQKQIEQLDEKYQEVLHLKFFEKMKIKEMSKALNKKPGTIKSLVSRGLAKLRANVEADPQEFVTNLKELKPSFRFVPAISDKKSE